MHPAAKTSVNQVPAIVKDFIKYHDGRKITSFDYGAGRFSKATEALATAGISNIPYDKYHIDPETNKANMARALQDPDLEVVFCANVLNVCLDKEDRIKIYQDLERISREGRKHPTILISVYEKNKDGVPDKTQMNQPSRFYAHELQEIFPVHKYYYLHRAGEIKIINKESKDACPL